MSVIQKDVDRACARRRRWGYVDLGHVRRVQSAEAGLADVLAPAPPIRRDWGGRYLRRVVCLDSVAALMCGAAACVLRFGGVPSIDYVLFILCIPLMWLMALTIANAYEHRFLGASVEEYRAVGRASVGFLGAVALGAYFTRQDLARGYTLILLPLLLACAISIRFGMRKWLYARRRQGQMMQRAVIVGRADAVGDVIRSIRSDPVQGLDPVAVCASALDASWEPSATIEGVRVLGTSRDAALATDVCDADVVVVAAHPDLSGQALRRLSWALDERGVELIVSPGLLDIAGTRMTIRPSTNLSLLHVERPANRVRHVLLKNAMDRALAFVMVLVLLPVMAVIAGCIKLGDRGPVFFRQKRVGVRGSTFDMLKFRTMNVDAKDSSAALASLSDGNGVLFKMRDDPRVTLAGRILRRYSLDELPQLFNVLIGDMSLVGPRPPLQHEVEQYEPDAMRRLHVRPGMTGLWQVSGRSDLSWEDSLRLDLRYVDNWSPLVDLAILARTVKAVTRASGAY